MVIMPPKVKMTPEQVEASLEKQIIIPCEPDSHRVNIFGECECGKFKVEDKYPT